MKNSFLILLFSFLFSSILFAQRDNLWLLGYDSNSTNFDFGGSVIDFSGDTAIVYYEFRDMNFDIVKSSICDTLGNLLFYTNGIYIANANNEPMENGEGLNPGPIANAFEEYGYPVIQGATILPLPESDSLYYLFHVNRNSAIPNVINSFSSIFYYSLIDMSENDGLGKVIEKNQIMIEDTLGTGKIQAVRHANGRDWWILIKSHDIFLNQFYKLLLSPEGVEVIDNQSIFPNISYNEEPLAQAVFSRDGTIYARHELRTLPVGHFLTIYDFDRCEGLLSNYRKIALPDTAYIGGVAISPNSRYLYATSSHFVYQFDLQADDISASKIVVAEYDGFVDFFTTRFFGAQLAPDDKIYISTNSGSRYLHVINEPDSAGLACDLQQHSFMLPTYNLFSLPNFPHFNLGALPNSPCDTLGIVDATEEIFPTQKVAIFPNPSSGNIQLKLTTPLSQNGQFILYDNLGKRVFEKEILKGVETQVFDFQHFPKEMYFYEIRQRDLKIGTGKLVLIE